MSDEPSLNSGIRHWQELRHQERDASAEELCRNSPELAAEVQRYLDEIAWIQALLGAANTSGRRPESTSGDGGEPLPISSPPQRLAGYELLGVLGRGGMGVVFQARQENLNRMVAVKMLRDGCLTSPEQRARFRAEAEAVARLRHPNVVQIHDVGEHRGHPYCVLEFVEGGSLDRHLARSPLPAREAAKLVELLARAAHVMHQAGVVHRDLKPANVLLTADGTPKVSDFGLAKFLGEEARRTQSGAVMGTPSYMAPEQADGKQGLVGPLTDVWALGAILYETLTGRPPFLAASPVETLMQVLGNEPVPLRRLQPKVPRDLETVCLKCLQKEPRRRYASALDLADDLRSFLDDRPIRARPVGVGERTVKWARRRPAAAALVLLALLVVPGFLTGGLLVQRRIEAARAADLVTMLLTADVERVPDTVRELAPYRSWVEAPLYGVVERSAPDSRERLRAALGLLPWDVGQAGYLGERLLTADPREVKVIREALEGRGAPVTPRLWAVLADPRVDPGQQLRAACALAELDPTSDQWPAVAPDVVARLTAEDALLVSGWAELLRPVRAELAGPLKVVFHDRRHTEHSHTAASILAEYLADDPSALVELIREADPVQVGLLAARLRPEGDQAVGLLQAELVSPEADAGRRANAAAALARLRHGAEVWRMLGDGSDPEARARLVHLLAPAGVDALVIADQLAQTADKGVRRALLLSLGEYGRGQLNQRQREALAGKLLRLYRTDPDPGVHSATDWLLRRWDYAGEVQRIDATLAAKESPVGFRWYVNSQGHTMAVVPEAVEYQMGSPESEPGRRPYEQRRLCRLRPFAIATKEVTVQQFQAFRQRSEAGTNPPALPQHPVGGLSFGDAARYCIWLSEREGIPPEEWCYDWDGREGSEVTVRKDHLSRKGYRLPTEEEWEYACRAGTETSRFFGDSKDLLGSYSWYRDNSDEHVWPVGQLKPNDLGLFDVLGNVHEWCWNCRGEGGAETRVMRGAAYRYLAGAVRRTSAGFESRGAYQSSADCLAYRRTVAEALGPAGRPPGSARC
jgi:formylglycine-generating enzyme required for sulfatase activity/predicted Ser/Thr protein kinase